jgi:hypothetical protein
MAQHTRRCSRSCFTALSFCALAMANGYIFFLGIVGHNLELLDKLINTHAYQRIDR